MRDDGLRFGEMELDCIISYGRWGLVSARLLMVFWPEYDLRVNDGGLHFSETEHGCIFCLGVRLLRVVHVWPADGSSCVLPSLAVHQSSVSHLLCKVSPRSPACLLATYAMRRGVPQGAPV